MIKYIDVSGKNEDEAIANALRQLGLERDEVSVEVLERAKTGFLGFGGTPAKVRVSYEVPDEEVPAKVEVKAPARPERTFKAAERQAEKPAAAPKVQASFVKTDKTQRIESFLNGLFEEMDVEAQLQLSQDEEGTINVTLAGENMGALIGRRGETLDAIQHLTNYAVNRGESGRTRINIDAENYRAKRADSLKRLAEKVAAKVVKYRRNITLEPMNAYERHVIHTALQDVPNVTTFSTGTEPNRRVVVSYERAGGRPEQSYDSRPSRPRTQRPSAPRPRPEQTEGPAAPAPAAAPKSQVPSSPSREWN